MNTNIYSTPPESELYHHGVKGMKWGVRRYQNPDGSLTSAGKKRYGSMSDDKLQKTLYKQVKKARAQQTGWSSQWNVNNTIGENSKAAQEKYNKARKEYESSEDYSKALKELKKLDNKAEAGKIDINEYDTKFESIRSKVYRADLDRSVRYTNSGRKYSQSYLDKYGRDLNIGYLKDLGYNDSVAKEFTDRILKANRKTLNGM